MWPPNSTILLREGGTSCWEGCSFQHYGINKHIGLIRSVCPALITFNKFQYYQTILYLMNLRVKNNIIWRRAVFNQLWSVQEISTLFSSPNFLSVSFLPAQLLRLSNNHERSAVKGRFTWWSGWWNMVILKDLICMWTKVSSSQVSLRNSVGHSVIQLSFHF